MRSAPTRSCRRSGTTSRPRSGTSLDRDEEGLDASYLRHIEVYKRIYDRCGLQYWMVESDVGMMGGLGAHEFMAPSSAGEDQVALCSNGDYAANVELAQSRPRPP